MRHTPTEGRQDLVAKLFTQGEIFCELPALHPYNCGAKPACVRPYVFDRPTPKGGETE
jgi:hypothetical protein